MQQLNVKLFSVKELFNKGTNSNQIIKVCDEIYNMVGFLCEDYPKHKSWFYQKHLPNTLKEDGNRDIIFAKTSKNVICGTVFIKYGNEKKICTLYVIPEERGKGVGTALVEKSMEILGTKKPIISFSEYKLPMFKGLIEKYGWQQTQILRDEYTKGNNEIVFNDYFEKQ